MSDTPNRVPSFLTDYAKQPKRRPAADSAPAVAACATEPVPVFVPPPVEFSDVPAESQPEPKPKQPVRSRTADSEAALRALREQLPPLTDNIYRLNNRILWVFSCGLLAILAISRATGLTGGHWWAPGLLLAALGLIAGGRPQRNAARTAANLALNLVAVGTVTLLVLLTGGIASPFFALQLLPLLTFGLSGGRKWALGYVVLLTAAYVALLAFSEALAARDILVLVIELALLPVIGFLIGDLREALLEETGKAKLADDLTATNRALEEQKERFGRIVAELDTLYNFTVDIGTSTETDDITRELMERVTGITGVEHMLVILRFDEELKVVGASAGLRDLVGSTQWAENRESENFALMAAEMLVQPELTEHDRQKLPVVLRDTLREPMMATLPLRVSSEVIGVLNLYSEHRVELENRQLMQLLLTFTAQGAVALQNIRTLANLKKAYLEAILAISAALDAKDAYTKGHSDRVRQYALAAAERFGLSDKDREWLDIGAMVHDIGKMGIDDAIIRKDRGLSDEEFEQIRQHPAIGARILEQMDFFRPCIPAIRHHHERWDGKGYPDRIAGETIAPMAQLVAVCDTFDAMTSNRTYRAALATEVAIAELVKNKGTQFSPQAVDAFVATLREDTKLRAEIEDRYQVWQYLWQANQAPPAAAAVPATSA